MSRQAVFALGIVAIAVVLYACRAVVIIRRELAAWDREDQR